MATDKNYITKVANNIRAKFTAGQLPSDGLEMLFNSYAVLALSKGESVTSRDVHDAWSAWATEYDPDNNSLTPFDELSEGTKAQDDKFVDAIRKTVAEMGLKTTAKIRLSVGAETSETEMTAVREAFESTDFELDLSAGLVRASADELPMYVAIIAQGLATNALWDLIKLPVHKVFQDTRINRPRSTEVIVRRKKYEAFISKDKFRVRVSTEDYAFPDLDSLIKYVQNNNLDD